MSASQRSVRLSARHVLGADGPICVSGRRTIRRCNYATAAAAVAEQEPTISHTPPVSEAAGPRHAYQIRAGILLSRPPLITRDLHPFEKAFFLYQRRLNERSALPFTRYFYYKKGTPADVEWKRKARGRPTPARDIGNYGAYTETGWNDELLVGATESEPDHQVEMLLKDAESSPGAGDKKGPLERPVPRITEADTRGDVKSLDRLLQRTLYLLVRNKDESWSFPSGTLTGKETLRRAAERILSEAAGPNVNTWVVGNHPVGQYINTFHPKRALRNEEQGLEQIGEKTFFMKARIMAGQADLSSNKFGLSDYKWLAKEEVHKAVDPRYWSAVKNMLPER